MKEVQPNGYLKVIADALTAPKVDDIIFLQYLVSRKKANFDPNTTKVGIIVTVDADEASIEGTISRSNRVMAVDTSYFNIPDIVKDPKVVKIGFCDPETFDLLRSSKSDEIELTTPWSGPEGDEWDSPSYDNFWNGAEQYFQKKVDLLRSVGKKVKVK